MVVDKDTHITTSMRRIMKMMQQREGGGAAGLETPPDLEINPDHPIMTRLAKARTDHADLAGQVAQQVFDNALVIAGMMEDPRAMLGRLNGLLERVLEK